MILTHKCCSNCNWWSEHKTILDDVIAAQCERDLLLKADMKQKLTKGSDKCGGWSKIKFMMFCNPMFDEIRKIKDYS